MLNKPNINELMQTVESKYTLVVVAAKRAREMTDKNPDLSASPTFNPVSAALNEVVEGKLHWFEQAPESEAEAASGEQE